MSGPSTAVPLMICMHALLVAAGCDEEANCCRVKKLASLLHLNTSLKEACFRFWRPTFKMVSLLLCNYAVISVNIHYLFRAIPTKKSPSPVLTSCHQKKICDGGVKFLKFM